MLGQDEVRSVRVGTLLRATGHQGACQTIHVEAPLRRDEHVGVVAERRAWTGGHHDQIDIARRLEAGITQKLFSVSVRADLVGLLKERGRERAGAHVCDANHADAYGIVWNQRQRIVFRQDRECQCGESASE